MTRSNLQFGVEGDPLQNFVGLVFVLLLCLRGLIRSRANRATVYPAEDEGIDPWVIDSVDLTLAFLKRVRLWPDFINDVEGCLCGAAKTPKTSRGRDRPNSRLSGLRTQAQANFLRS